MAQTSKTLQIVVSLKDNFSKGFKDARSRVKKLTGAVFNLKTAFVSLGSGLVARDIVKTKNEFVLYQKTLETLEGSTAKAAAKWQELLEFAEITPYTIAQVVKSYKTLRAFGLDPTIETMRILGDTAAALGGPDVLGRVALVLGQIQAQGFMSAQDMNQLANAGINAAKIMSDAFGVTRNEVMALRKQGVEAHQIIDLLLKAMKEQFGGQMVAINKEMIGQWERLKSIWQRFAVAIMDSGVYAYITSALTIIADKITELRTQGKLDLWAEKMGKSVIAHFESMALGAAEFYDVMAPIMANFKKMFTSIWDWFKQLPAGVQSVGLIGFMLGGPYMKALVLTLGSLSDEIRDSLKLLKIYGNALVSNAKNVDLLKVKLLALTNERKKLQEPPKVKTLFGVPFQANAEETRARIKSISTEIDSLVEIINAAKQETLEIEIKETGTESMVSRVSAAIEKIRAKVAVAQIPVSDVSVPAPGEAPAPAPTEGPQLSQLDAMKAAFSGLKAFTETSLVELNALYDQGQVAFSSYWDERRAQMETVYNAELELLAELAMAETDPAKKLELETDLYVKQEEYSRAKIELIREEQTAEEELFAKRIELNDIMADLTLRAQEEKYATIEVQFQAEMAALDRKQQEEMQRIMDLTAFIKTEEEKRALIKDAYRKQELEKEKVLADQKKRLQQSTLRQASDVAGGLKNIGNELYEMSGRQNKKAFALAKAAAMAEAVINGALAMTKALAQGGFFGIAMAAVVAAMTGIQIAKIQSTEMGGSFAEGGPIPGHSPHPRADNIPINATAGEFMQPVSAVQYYGNQAMEAIRLRLIPKELLSGIGGLVPKQASNFAATGGRIVTKMSKEIMPKIEIVNITNPDAIRGLALDAVHENRDIVVNMVLNELEDRNISLAKAYAS